MPNILPAEIRYPAHWRQHHFRPHKPLPVESSGHNARNRARSQGFLRTAAQVLASVLLLGVPYLFYNRAAYHRADAEGGTGIGGRSILPVLVAGACTCLLVSLPTPPASACAFVYELRDARKAAILLSASITFLSLPGLDNIARLAALVVALLAACSMASGLVALFRYKSELAEPAAAQLNPAHVGREGLMLISVSSILPKMCSWSRVD